MLLTSRQRHGSRPAGSAAAHTSCQAHKTLGTPQDDTTVNTKRLQLVLVYHGINQPTTTLCVAGAPPVPLTDEHGVMAASAALHPQSHAQSHTHTHTPRRVSAGYESFSVIGTR